MLRRRLKVQAFVSATNVAERSVTTTILGRAVSLIFGKPEQMTDEFDKFADDLQEIMLQGYSKQLRDEFLNPKNIGRMERADSYAKIKGICGDTIEMYLSIENDAIKDITFMTDGCGVTIASVSYAARMLKGKTLHQALQIRAEDIDSYFGGLPVEHQHCAELAVLSVRTAVQNYQNPPVVYHNKKG